jgi:hypothetical protein
MGILNILLQKKTTPHTYILPLMTKTKDFTILHNELRHIENDTCPHYFRRYNLAKKCWYCSLCGATVEEEGV